MAGVLETHETLLYSYPAVMLRQGSFLPLFSEL